LAASIAAVPRRATGDALIDEGVATVPASNLCGSTPTVKAFPRLARAMPRLIASLCAGPPAFTLRKHTPVSLRPQAGARRSKPVSGTAADTPHGRAAPAMPWCTGHRSTNTAQHWTGLCRCGVSPPAPALRANRLAPCQLRVTSFASKSRLLDWHPLYVSAHAAPHVRASRYGLELPHGSKG